MFKIYQRISTYSTSLLANGISLSLSLSRFLHSAAFGRGPVNQASQSQYWEGSAVHIPWYGLARRNAQYVSTPEEGTLGKLVRVLHGKKLWAQMHRHPRHTGRLERPCYRGLQSWITRSCYHPIVNTLCRILHGESAQTHPPRSSKCSNCCKAQSHWRFIACAKTTVATATEFASRSVLDSTEQNRTGSPGVIWKLSFTRAHLPSWTLLLVPNGICLLYTFVHVRFLHCSTAGCGCQFAFYFVSGRAHFEQFCHHNLALCVFIFHKGPKNFSDPRVVLHFVALSVEYEALRLVKLILASASGLLSYF